MAPSLPDDDNLGSPQAPSNPFGHDISDTLPPLLPLTAKGGQSKLAMPSLTGIPPSTFDIDQMPRRPHEHIGTGTSLPHINVLCSAKRGTTAVAPEEGRGKKHKALHGAPDVIFRTACSLSIPYGNEVPRSILAYCAGYGHVKTKSFEIGLAYLSRDRSLLECSKGVVTVTKLGSAMVEEDAIKVKDLKDNEDIHQSILAVLSQKKDLDAHKLSLLWRKLSDGRVYSREVICKDVLGYKHLKTKAFEKMISTLAKLALVKSHRGGDVELSDVVFPFGRPSETSESF